uniref:C2H2-type domain-containing protein n=1 Tax=Strigamia maritima TaxID=126957 RepID=T1IXE9_STRMM
MEIRCSPSPQSVPEMLTTDLTQSQSMTANEEVVLIFDDGSLNNESYDRISNAIQIAETSPTGDTELQVVPESAFAQHVTSENTQLVVMPTSSDAQEVPVSTSHDVVEESSSQITWQKVDEVTTDNENGINLLCDAVSKEETAARETRVMAFDSSTGEIVDMDALRGEMGDGQVTYIVHDENDEDGASYRIVTDEQLRQMHEAEAAEVEGSYILQDQDEIESFVEEKVDDLTQLAEGGQQVEEMIEEAENESVQQQQPQIIDLGSDISCISADNMQALLQILQALPVQSEGQTLQVVLQGSADGPQVFQLENSIARAEGTTDNEVVHLVQMVEGGGFAPLPAEIKTINNAVQASQEQSMKKTNFRPLSSGLRGRRAARPLKNEKKLIGKPVNYTCMSDGDGDESDGMNGYLMMDCPSEPEDGYSSAQEVVSGAVLPKSDFMEDYLEVQFDGKNLLSSTLDESVVESPFNRKASGKGCAAQNVGTSIDLPDEVAANGHKVTLPARTYEEVKMNGKNLAEASYDESDPLNRPPRYTRGLRTLPRRTVHRCGYCEYESRDKWMVAQHCRTDHEGEIVRVMTMVPECSRRQCPYCKKWFNYAEFFQHMRFSHNDVHPFKCFYCDFQGRDRNQVKHHICKKHAKPARIINLMRDLDAGELRKKAVSEGEESVYEYVTEDEDEESGIWEEGLDRKSLTCPECKKTFKSLKYLKTHIKMHRPNRFQCGYCDYIATLEHQILKHSLRKHGTAEPRVVSKELEPEKNPLISRDIDSVVRRVFSMSLRQPKDEDPLTWARKWTCPHCDYTCQFGASFRRHIRMHANLLPFKCNYCSFKGREKYYVRRHIARMHRGLPEIVVDNTAENRAGDTSSDEDYQEKGLRRRRKRKTKNVLKAVVPVAAPTTSNVHVVVKKDLSILGISDDDMDDAPEISFDKADYILERIDDDVICKVCEGRISWDDFQNHVMKHESSYGCVYCDYTAYDRSKVRAHVLAIHPSMPFCVVEDIKENASNFHCPICQELLMVADEIGLREHFYMHYDFKPYSCGLCDFRDSSKETVVAHGEMTHGEVMDVVMSDIVPPDGLEDTIQQFVRVINANEELVSSRVMDEVTSLKKRRGRPPKTVRTTMRRFECPICHCTTNRHAATVRRHLYSHFDYRPYVCGYCGHRTFSDNDVRQHIVNSHGKVLPKVSISDERTPSELENLLASVNEQLNSGSSKFPASSDPTSLVTEEGKRWHDILSRGVCPWCDEFVGHFRPTAYRHLKTHFQCKPYRCGHCSFCGSERLEIKLHSATTHPNENVSVVGPSIKMAEIEEGLRRYLQSHPNVLEKSGNETSDDVSKVESEEAVRGLVQEENVNEPQVGCIKDSVDKNISDQILEEMGKSDEIDVPIDLLEDVCYLLQLSCLPQDIPLTRRRMAWHRCEHCKQKFRKSSDLREHIMSEHPSDVTAYSCCYCEYWNFNKTFVTNHILSSHSGRRILIKEKVYDKKRKANHSSDESSAKKSRSDENSLTLVETSVEEMPIKRKRGRPPKSTTIQDISHTKEINVVVRMDASPTAKRGRPKKLPLILEEKNVEKVQDEIELQNFEECDDNLPKVMHILTLS